MLALEKEVLDLKERIARLEATVLELAKQPQPVAPPTPTNGEALSHSQLMAWMRARGMLVELPPEAKKRTDRWRALSDEKKQAHIGEMHKLILDPPLSQIIIDNRR